MIRALVALVAAGCYSPTIADGQYACSGPTSSKADCPIGFTCNYCGLCVADTDLTNNDLGAALCANRVDLAMGGLPGCASNGGARAPGDPGLPSVALCLAAFSVPGIVADAPTRSCGTVPPDGKGCAAIDNCAIGWHVCTDGDLVARGFTRADCMAVPPGLWATATHGFFNGATGRTDCAAAGANNVLGCSMTPVSFPTGVGCVVVVASMSAQLCGMAGGWSSWSCDPAQTDSEAATVTKASLSQGGGVMCCK